MRYKSLAYVGASVVAAAGLSVRASAQPQTGQGANPASSAVMPVAAVQATPGTITVVGHGRGDATPDHAMVQVGVVTEDAQSAATAGAACAERMTRVLDAVKKLVIDTKSIQTTGVSLTPVYDYSNQANGRPPTIHGYRASSTVRVRLTDLSKVGPVIDSATKAGANEVQGVTFGLENDAAIKQGALSRAAMDARAKALAITGPLGLRIGEVLEVSEGVMPMRPPIPMLRGMSNLEQTMAMPIEAGQVGVEAEVTIKFALRSP